MKQKIRTLFTHHYSLITILILASFLRLWLLGTNPPHLNSDEAALGYNAYSILKTARDEHGEFLPIVFKSFGDWKPGLYVYLTVPFVAIMGLNEWSVRLPSAIAGITAVWLIYLVTKALFPQKMENGNWKLENLSALTLALTPWHIHFSRGAWEANVALTLLLGGIYFFLKFTEGSRKSILLSSALFALTLWAYQGAKLSTLIVVLLLTVIYAKKLLKEKPTLFKAIMLGALVSVPVLLSFTQGKTGRLEVFSVFSYRRPDTYVQNILDQANEGFGSWQYYLHHSEPISLGRGVLGRWLNHYSGSFLFFEGDENKRHHATDTGMLLLIQAPLLALGFVGLFKTKDTRTILFIIGWLILAPLPAALSRDSSHAVRSYQFVVPIVIISALGTLYLLEELKFKKILTYVLLGGLFINFLYYLDQYYIHYPKHDSKAWAYGYKQVVKKLALEKDKQIIFQQSYNQPYIFFLFHQKYDPKKFQQISKEEFIEDKLDVGKLKRLDNIYFKDATLGDLQNSNAIIVYDPETPPFPAILTSQPNIEKNEIKRLDNTTAFIILKHK